MITIGKIVRFDYVLKVDGKQIESSQTKGMMEYIHGEKQLVPGLERQLAGLNVGDKRTIKVKAKEAYGKIDRKAFRKISKSSLPANFELEVGKILSIKDKNGFVLKASVYKILKDEVIFNFNHPLAGKDLEYEVMIISIEEY